MLVPSNYEHRDVVVRTLFMTIFLLVISLAHYARAASFDCGKAATPTEMLICARPDLSSLDEELQRRYQVALRTVKPAVAPSLKREQANWLRYVRDICLDVDCLHGAYEARIDLLSKTERILVDDASCSIPDGNSCRSVVYYRDSSHRMASFNKSLLSHKQGGRLIGCDRLISLPVGYANSNDSFGGFCTLVNDAKRSRVMICDGDMFGHFAMRLLVDGDRSDGALIKFTNDNCFGG